MWAMTEPLEVLPAIEAWKRLEPSFRGAVLAQMMEQRDRDLVATSNLSVRNRSNDPDVDALAVRMAKLLDARAVAIRILQEAAR
jgi:hypothetical protein